MKKVFLVMVALVAISVSNVNAQVVWGVRAGLSRPTNSGNWETYKGKFGLEVGPVLYYSLQNNFYINSGTMFSIKTLEGGTDRSFSLYYLDIPLYAGYNFVIGGSTSFYAQAGPFAGIKIHESEDSAFGGFNAGLAAMAGVNVNRFKIELGYQMGLTNVLKSDYENYGDYSIKLSSLFIGVSYVF